MSLYLLSYDLHHERNYKPLHGELQRMGATRLLESVWSLEVADTSAQELLDHFKAFIDQDDSLLVSQTSEWATHQTDAIPSPIQDS